MRSNPFCSAPHWVSESRAHRNAGSKATESILKYFSIRQIADLLGVSTRTVRRWIDAELLVTHRIGSVVRIATSDLRAFLAQHRAS